MQIPTYWSRALVDDSGRELEQDDGLGFYGIGWSDTSEADARQKALERARKIAERFNRDGNMFSLREQYYADRPLREPVIDEMQVNGQRAAVITQNVYGAYVMNTVSAMFVDIDVPHPPVVPGLIGRLLFRMKPPSEEEMLPPEQRIQDAIASERGLGMKVYRTPAGFRGLVTSAPMQPGSDEAQRLMRSFESDPLYITLCRSQQSFRARLTPKPWRIGMDNPPKTFPFFDSAKQAAFDQWKQAYDARITRYAACEPMSDEPWGNPQVHPEIAPVLAMHDELACSPGKPLA